MHKTQRAILDLSIKRDLSGLKLREIGELVGEPHPQKIKHHLDQLKKKGFLGKSGNKEKTGIVPKDALRSIEMSAIPILGSANCGEAVLSANEMLEGYLNVSKSLVRMKPGMFALKAKGSSMDHADVSGNAIENGDYVIIDPSSREPKNGDYVLSVINGAANIKKFMIDRDHNRVLLVSESGGEYLPIIIHLDDGPDYFVNGKVVFVIKKPVLN